MTLKVQENVNSVEISKGRRIAIKIRNLWHSYRNRKQQIASLEDINIDIYEGELLAIAGPNGSGKTTLVRHLNGLENIQRGSIEIFGEEFIKDNKKRLRRNIGLVFQNPDEQIFYPKVYDDVAFGPKNLGLSFEDVDLKATHALKEAQIEHLRDRIAFNLSYGEKKRVAFAGILAMDPKIIILDEPTIGIDPWTKPAIFETIQNFRNHHTVILVTHDLSLLKKAERIALLWEGKLKGVYNTYSDFYHAAFGHDGSCCTEEL
ncbi:MAG: energy-coupling factor ABC transporter ATP-binding protein [Candidatus Hodarchaeales archaeon]